jgi:hypothetical protein
VTLAFDRYPRFDELSQALQRLADDHPGLVELTSIGRSGEGRDLWLATVTNQATGPHLEKPAVWLDGNIHASEVTPSVALLHLVHHLCTGHGTDREITRAVDTRTFYILPRVNPDGAELALAEVPRVVRSVTRAWPLADEPHGFVPGDIDLDGRQLQIRIPDPNGTWKPFAADPRLLVARQPTEVGDGPYYRLLREGRLVGDELADAHDLRLARPWAGIDANRNFPYNWRRFPDSAVAPQGDGDFPTSEPEVRAVVQAVVDRPNITAYLAYHTYSGVHLRPYSDLPDDKLPTQDLRIYQAIGKAYTAITGYPSLSVYHGFRYDPKDVITGVADDWAYDQRGVFAWTTEFWNPLVHAGIEDADPLGWYREHSLDDELKLYAWVQEHVPDGYVDWYAYDHPQLGPVELGGWHQAAVFRNPPPHLLEAEVAPHSELAVWQALVSPLLAVRATGAEALGADTWRVWVEVENQGWLPTEVTKRAVAARVVDGTRWEISVPDGVTLVRGTPVVRTGQLSGRALKTSAVGSFGPPHDGSDDRGRVEWLVRAPAGTELPVTVSHERAGTVRTSVSLA